MAASPALGRPIAATTVLTECDEFADLADGERGRASSAGGADAAGGESAWGAVVLTDCGEFEDLAGGPRDRAVSAGRRGCRRWRRRMGGCGVDGLWRV